MEQNEQQKQYKYKIAFDQGKNGIISFSGYIHFDDEESYKPTTISKNADLLSQMLSLVEHHFKQKGYRVASDTKPKGESRDD
jgi:hypothetical protein